jgi:predicted phage-related endonuclease
MQLGLTAEQKKERLNYIGGSDANILMLGSDEEILKLWKVKRGEAEGDNLDDVLQVQLGQFTEPFNRYWFTKTTKREITNDGEHRICMDYPFMAATLDGLTDNKSTLWEAKHVSAFYKDIDVLNKYTPQLMHNMIVTGLKSATLSAIFGNHKLEVFNIELDDEYAAELIKIEENFWSCVQNGIEPVIVAPKYEGPVTKIVDMSSNNAWATWAKEFSATHASFKIHEKSKKELKELEEKQKKYMVQRIFMPKTR